jgi:hypothetical protein
MKPKGVDAHLAVLVVIHATVRLNASARKGVPVVKRRKRVTRRVHVQGNVRVAKTAIAHRRRSAIRLAHVRVQRHQAFVVAGVGVGMKVKVKVKVMGSPILTLPMG